MGLPLVEVMSRVPSMPKRRVSNPARPVDLRSPKGWRADLRQLSCPVRRKQHSHSNIPGAEPVLTRRIENPFLPQVDSGFWAITAKHR
jgi:hypothetical protein